MSLKQYGIFLAYSPVVDMRSDGLGRYLAGFLRGVAARSDVRFVVACPSWMHKNLRQLCEDEQVPTDRIELLSPNGLPLSLRFYNSLQRRGLRRQRDTWIARAFARVILPLNRLRNQLERKLLSTRSFVEFLAFGALAAVLAVLMIVPWLITGGLIAAITGARRAWRTLLRSYNARVHRILAVPSRFSIRSRFYPTLESSEIDLLIYMINQRKDIQAWYCPTAFWPGFNKIKSRRLLCLPDIVMGEAPVGFAQAGGKHTVERLNQLENSIKTSDQIVTYSEHVKWLTCVERYSCAPEVVHVIPHAASTLSDQITMTGTIDDNAATESFARELLLRAFTRSTNPEYTLGFRNTKVEFLFYASQVRAHKNVLTLLRAFNYLLKRRFVQLKLILTGDVRHLPDIAAYVEQQNIGNDVICLRDLPVQELAACYKLAQLAVNPSLSEGGCPFTFTEALSVGTPVVMARIPVTEEVITDPKLQAMMLFDPYDWKSMADRIEWALQHRSELLMHQQPFYERLAQRTWRHVVDDHIAILDRIAAERGDAGLRA